MLRTSLTLTLMTLSLTATAAEFDFVPAQNPAQKAIHSQLQSGDFKAALGGWDEAFAGSGFASSANGIATWAYALAQSGLPFLATETVLRHTDPHQIDAQLLKLWTINLNNSPFIQKGWLETSGAWRQIVDNTTPHLRLKSARDLNRAFATADRLPKGAINARARIWWQIATQAPQIDQTEASLKALKLLRDSTQTAIGADLISLTQARTLFQKGDLTAALASYQQIPKRSDLWIESLEERAWVHVRQAQYDQALADVTTATSPALASLAGPETYFLTHLLTYRVCDYPRLFHNSDAFKARHRQRLLDIQELAQKGSNRASPQLISQFDRDGVSPETAGPLVNTVPREIYRDHQYVSLMESRRQILIELAKTGSLKGGLMLGALVTHAKGEVEQMRQSAVERAKVLALTDLKEYRIVINKMNIIEAEVIQRLHLDESLSGKRNQLTDAHDRSDAIVFPYSDEVWMDELDHYQAQVKNCPQLKALPTTKTAVRE